MLTDQWNLFESRQTATGLDIGWKATQVVKTLQPGKGYALSFKTRGPGSVAVKFFTAKWEVFRSYSRTVQDTYEGRIEFTAPEYAVNAEVSIHSAGSPKRILVDAIELAEAPAYRMVEPTVWSPIDYPPPAPGYQLVFNDEFQGTALNRRKWHTRMIYAGGTLDHLSGETQRYRDTHVVSGGILKLPAKMEADGSVTSAMIRSEWTGRYGYFEARVRMPKGIGVFPAFWLNPDVGTDGVLSWPPEIDMFEFVNNGKEDTANMLHSGIVCRNPAYPVTLISAQPTWNEQYGYWRAPFDLTDSFHTIGYEWTPGLARLFVDGRHIYARKCPWVRDDGAPGPNAHVILNFALGGSWAGRHGVDTTALNSSFDVAFVRVWQKKG
jgi:beta-glucanase (GH16 family)